MRNPKARWLVVGLAAVLSFVVGLLGKDRCGQTPLSASHEEAMKWADQTLAGLTLEKKIGQMICIDIVGGYIVDDDPQLEH